jgi:hypothetical protein
MRKLISISFVLLLAAAQAWGQATVTEIGNANTNYATTLAITVASGASSAQGVVVFVVSTVYTARLTDCTDNATGGANTYQIDNGGANSATADGLVVMACSAYLTRALQSNATITLTFSNNPDVMAYAYTVSSFASSSWLDSTIGTATNGYTTSQTATGGTASGNDTVFAVWGRINGSTASIATGYTSLLAETQLRSTGRYVVMGYKRQSSGSIASTGSMVSLGGLVGETIAYKEAAAAATKRRVVIIQ